MEDLQPSKDEFPSEIKNQFYLNASKVTISLSERVSPFFLTVPNAFKQRSERQ